MGTVASAGARLPLATIEEVTLLARELVESGKALVSVQASDAVPCVACFARTHRMASWVIEGTARFYCEACVDAARQQGLIEDVSKTTAASAGVARLGQRLLLANYAEATRLIFGLTWPVAEAARARLASMGIQTPVPESDEARVAALFAKLNESVEGSVLMSTMYVEAAMREAVPFLLPEDVSELLALTDNARLDETAHLPFAKCWLDGQFHHDERTYYGLLAVETVAELGPLPAGEGSKRALALRKSEPHTVTLVTAYKDADGRVGIVGVMDALSKKRRGLILDLQGSAPSRREARFLADVLQNWLDLLDSPQVVRSDVTLSRRERDMHQRATSQEAPSRIVRVRIVDRVLRESIDRFREGLAHYSHRFRVKGHKRLLRAQRWRESRGKLVWIAPYFKGHGILVEKVYEVEPLQPAPPDIDGEDVA